MRTFKGHITKLEPHQYVVFGSNTQGIHMAGNAGWALKNAGAILGQSRGFQGRGYAICTTELVKQTEPKHRIGISRQEIIDQIVTLYQEATDLPQEDFLVMYTAGTTNLSGFTPEAFADMFWLAAQINKGLPENIVFEESFLELINNITKD